MPVPRCTYQLKITLKDVSPPIWRRVLVPDDATFRTLHETIQLSFGWWDSHLHEFSSPRKGWLPREGTITDLETLDGYDPELGVPADERKVRLRDQLEWAGQRMDYNYDFGDCWGHEVLLERVLVPEEGVGRPVCVGGRRACPPEDCGGTGGYTELIKAINDPGHERHAELLDWLGLQRPEDFDPEAFDVEATDALLQRGYQAWASSMA
jgi:hypothetical protein